MEWCALCSFCGTTLNWRVSRFAIDNKFGRIKYIQNQNHERLSFCVVTTLRHYLQKQTSLANYLHLSHFGITLYNTIVTKQTKVKFLEIAMNPRGRSRRHFWNRFDIRIRISNKEQTWNCIRSSEEGTIFNPEQFNLTNQPVASNPILVARNIFTLQQYYQRLRRPTLALRIEDSQGFRNRVGDSTNTRIAIEFGGRYDQIKIVDISQQSQPISVRKLRKTLQRVRKGKYVRKVSNVHDVRNLIIIYIIFQQSISIDFTVLLYRIIVIKRIQMNKFIQLKLQTLVKTIKYNLLLYLFYNYILSFYVKFKRYGQNIIYQIFKLLLDIIFRHIEILQIFQIFQVKWGNGILLFVQYYNTSIPTKQIQVQRAFNVCFNAKNIRNPQRTLEMKRWVALSRSCSVLVNLQIRKCNRGRFNLRIIKMNAICCACQFAYKLFDFWIFYNLVHFPIQYQVYIV
ncbi:Hypothetical_protein [Hexamita inflata]|uniref:Hypothetical_protein n=1 Tax=Hexamita inflata TaxID=28002 RepID=A0AA86VT27_9EUKA|nr:Hypothetical protein HINF_LOCUS64563 [Hexamita inflata]